MIDMKLRTDAIGPNRPKFMDDPAVIELATDLINGKKGPGSWLKYHNCGGREEFQMVCNTNWAIFCLGGSIGIRAHRPGEPMNKLELVAMDINNIKKGRVRFSPFQDNNNSRAAAAVKILQIESGEAVTTYIKDDWVGKSVPELERARPVATVVPTIVTQSHDIVNSDGVPFVHPKPTPEPISSDEVVVTDDTTIHESKDTFTDKVKDSAEERGVKKLLLIEERRAIRLGMCRKTMTDSLTQDFVRILSKAKAGQDIKCALDPNHVGSINFMSFTSGYDMGIAHRGKGYWIKDRREVEAINEKTLRSGTIRFSQNPATNATRIERAIDILNKEKGITTSGETQSNGATAHVRMPAPEMVHTPVPKPVQVTRPMATNIHPLAATVDRIMSGDVVGLTDRMSCIEAAAKMLQKAGVLNDTLRKNLNEAILDVMMDSKDLLADILG